MELIKNEGTPPLIKKEGTHYFWAPPPAGHLRLGYIMWILGQLPKIGAPYYNHREWRTYTGTWLG